MKLLRLAAQDFRNLAPFELDLGGARFVVFHGPNAQGKTNALEAVYLLATLKPLRGRRVRELVRWGAEGGSVAASVEAEGVVRGYRLDVGPDGRVATLDGKRVSDLGEWFAGVRAIAFTPQDGRIVAGEPSFRRAWLDRAAFTATPAHLDVVRLYKRCLEQKSAALKSPRVDLLLLDTLDDQLARAGAELVQRRVDLLRELQPHVRDLHGAIAGASTPVELKYRTDARGDGVEARAAALRARIAEARSGELNRRTALVGPQTDDVAVVLGGRSARTFGSRGQVRSLVLSLKLAELVAARERGDVPLFLLDDVSSELDRQRTRHLVGTLRELGAQVLVTTTDPEHMDTLPADETLMVAVQAGNLEAAHPTG